MDSFNTKKREGSFVLDESTEAAAKLVVDFFWRQREQRKYELEEDKSSPSEVRRCNY